MRITNTSGWIVLKKNKYFEFLYRHEFQGDGDQDGNLWDRNIEIRAKLVSLNGHDNGIANPFIMIQGPMKEVTVQVGNVEKEGLVWEYPWDALTKEDERNDSQRGGFFLIHCHVHHI
jgi:hypothetical protein